MLLLSGLGLFGTLFTVSRSKAVSGKGKSLMLIALLALVASSTGLTVACGNYSKQPTGNNATINVIGTSGAESHSFPVSVTVR